MPFKSRWVLAGLSFALFVSPASISIVPEGDEPPSKVSRPPILILGDAGFTPANGVIGGLGTKDDPFRIEGWSIDLATSPSNLELLGQSVFDAGIIVNRTTMHFRIRDVDVFNGGETRGGIYLGEVKHAEVNATRLTDDRFGVAVVASEDVRIGSSNVSRYRDNGIVVSGSTGVVVGHNELHGGKGGAGIGAIDMEAVALTHNRVTWHHRDDPKRIQPAFIVERSTDVTIDHNSVVAAGDVAFYVHASPEARLRSNHVDGTGLSSIVVARSPDTQIVDNEQRGSGQSGLIVESDRARVERNSLRENAIGIALIGNGSWLGDNALTSNHEVGIVVQGNDTTVINNTIADGEHGILLVDFARRNEVRDNDVRETRTGIFSNAEPSDNLIHSNEGKVVYRSGPPGALSPSNLLVVVLGLGVVFLFVILVARRRKGKRGPPGPGRM